MREIVLQGRKVVGGVAEGRALVAKGPISFLGGINAENGLVTEKRHELEGECVTGKILVYTTGKGSTGGSFRIYEMADKGTAPAAIINEHADSVTAIGAIMGEIPMVHRFEQDPVEVIETGDWVRVEAGAGLVKIKKE